VTDREPICLPCFLADYHGDDEHDCVGAMAFLDDVGVDFVMVTCACPKCHPQTTTPTPDPRRGDGG